MAMQRFLAVILTCFILSSAACTLPSRVTVNHSQIEMGASNFIGNVTITIRKGQSITFVDPTGSGGTHDLVTGKNGVYVPEQGAPSDLNQENGVMFNAGQTKIYQFATAGTYDITCTIHAPMQATITVQ